MKYCKRQQYSIRNITDFIELYKDMNTDIAKSIKFGTENITLKDAEKFKNEYGYNIKASTPGSFKITIVPNSFKNISLSKPSLQKQSFEKLCYFISNNDSFKEKEINGNTIEKIDEFMKFVSKNKLNLTFESNGKKVTELTTQKANAIKETLKNIRNR